MRGRFGRYGVLFSPHSVQPGSDLTIDADLVRRLVAHQFPAWAHLAVRPVDVDGWDNRTFRVGENLSARLPSAPGYAPQVRKEMTWLPRLAESVRLPIPEIVAVGTPGEGYPFEWTLRRWIDGIPASHTAPKDTVEFAEELARFLGSLRAADPVGPPPGLHSAYRGSPLERWDAQTRATIEALGGRIDGRAALAEWQRARRADDGASTPVWFHGDVAPSNLLLRDGRLAAVIDFGCCGVGDPACDLAIVWTTFDVLARSRFRDVLGVDDAEWARGRGWALWKALITLDDPRHAVGSAAVLDALGIGRAAPG